jgi:hypothetical protein
MVKRSGFVSSDVKITVAIYQLAIHIRFSSDTTADSAKRDTMDAPSRTHQVIDFPK